jgi:hypothetical protein
MYLTQKRTKLIEVVLLGLGVEHVYFVSKNINYDGQELNSTQFFS